MAMTVIVTGKLYNGKTFEWKDKSKEDRTLFRGRLNYRDRTNGEWYFVDAVCWKDFGKENGLVGFLEENFSADSDNAPTDKGGQAVELVGYFRPVKRTKTEKVPKKFRIGGKVQTVEVEVEVEYIGYEFVIETADYPPTSEKFTGSRNKKKDDEIVDFDAEDDELVELIDDEEDEDIIEEVEEEEEAPKLTAAQKKKAEALAKKKKAEALAKKKREEARKAAEETIIVQDDDDDQFFDE